MNEVKIEDRDISIEYLRMALNMCQIGVNYQQAELIFAVVNKCELLGGSLTVDNACAIFSAHKKKWDKYFNEDK